MNVRCALILILVAGCGILNSQPVHDRSSVAWQEGYLDIHHINTGRGNCAFFVLPDGTTMLIDAGDIDDSAGVRMRPLQVTPPYPDNTKNSGEWIVDYIRQVLPGSVPIIDYAVITHYHSDHMGVIQSATKTAAAGGYKLTGITQVGALLSIKHWIDRGYPANDFPINLNRFYQGDNSIFLNAQQFIAYHKSKGLKAAPLQVGTTSQIVLKYPARYPGFKVRGVKRNGTIWTGVGDQTFEYFTSEDVIDQHGKFNENPLSLALKISYGKFDYYSGGDNTGLQGYGLPQWFDVETPIARAVGKVEVATLDHHGNRDATNENFLTYLQPKAVVEQTWCSDHPGQEVMHRLISDHIYTGEKNIFATNIQEPTMATLGFWLTRGYKSLFGHVIVRVLPGGERFYILIAETLNGKVGITKAFGPYDCE